jgi:hypothetical protein
MILFAQIFTVFSLWVAFNTIFVSLFRNKTRHSLNKQGDSDEGIMIWLFIIIGPIMLLFRKQIKRYRMYLYLKRRINYYKWMDLTHVETGYKYDNLFDNEIKKMERIYKISKMYQKTRRKRILKKLISQ